MTLFDTWVYAKAIADLYHDATVQRTADGKYAVWIQQDDANGYYWGG